VLLRKRNNLPKIFKKDYYETSQGSFYIENDLDSTIVVSPAFERRDIELLLILIRQQLSQSKKILFVDIGAHFGKYTVIVGKRFKSSNVRIFSFEPDKKRYTLLKKNLRTNNIKNFRSFNVGLGSKKGKNDLGITTDRLDRLIGKEISKFDHIIVKMDIDGYETEALRGARSVVKNSKELTLLIEDFVDKKIIKHLEKDFNFIDKFSTYNSFWTKK
jgi:hypothetical protein